MLLLTPASGQMIVAISPGLFACHSLNKDMLDLTFHFHWTLEEGRSVGTHMFTFAHLDRECKRLLCLDVTFEEGMLYV